MFEGMSCGMYICYRYHTWTLIMACDKQLQIMAGLCFSLVAIFNGCYL